MCPRLQQIRTALEPRVLADKRARSGRVPSDTAVIQNRALRTSRPRAAVSAADATAVRKVAIVPGEAFGAPGYARLSYALNDDDLEEGLDRMGQALERAQD